MFKGTLRNKFLLSLALISALLSFATLMVVRERVQVHAREEIGEGLRNSVATFQSLQQQREVTLEHSAALLASLPPLKAVMTSQHPATIQDASDVFWKLSGSELFVLADRSGRLMAIHPSDNAFTKAEAETALARSLASGESRDWWYGGGHLYQVFLRPIHVGSPDDDPPIGVLAIGYEVEDKVAVDVSRVAASQVAFQYQNTLVVSTVAPSQRPDLALRLQRLTGTEIEPEEIQLGRERFLATSVRLSNEKAVPVFLTVLKSFDAATSFLQSINRWIVGVGFAAVLAGSILVYFVSTTFTKPLANLVGGVHALERGNFEYPLPVRGNDEVSELTAAFHRMRIRLQESQRQLLDHERLATIGRMASTISHDLRHPLTAILAYAEFLSEGQISEAQRKDFYQEIRIAVNRMTDEISSLLGFSKQREAMRTVHGRVDEVIERAITTVKVNPELEAVEITFLHDGPCVGWFDPGKVERVMLNLLFNAAEAVSHKSGKIDVSCKTSDGRIEIRVADNGPGIPEAIRDTIFEPFVSQGKETGIGLGLTVVQKVMQDHGGEVVVEKTGADGTVFKLIFPAAVVEQGDVLRSA